MQRGQTLVVDQSRFRIKLLGRTHSLDQGFYLSLQVVALIDHVSDIRAGAGFPLIHLDLTEDSKDLIRIDRAQSQVVVGETALLK